MNSELVTINFKNYSVPISVVLTNPKGSLLELTEHKYKDWADGFKSLMEGMLMCDQEKTNPVNDAKEEYAGISSALQEKEESLLNRIHRKRKRLLNQLIKFDELIHLLEKNPVFEVHERMHQLIKETSRELEY